MASTTAASSKTYDPFLEAPLGEQPNGMPVSVFSALARLGIEPRREAERLAQLSENAAAAALEGMIAQVSDGHWIASDAKNLAKRAIELLPTRRTKIEAPAEGGPSAAATRRKQAWLWIVVGVLAGAVLYVMLPAGNSPSDTPAFYSPSWTGERTP
jgi:hypothetical protein